MTSTVRTGTKALPQARTKHSWGGLLYIAPSFAILCLIAIVPIIYTMFLSFTHYDMFSSPKPVGLENYTRLFQDKEIGRAVWNTALMTLIVVPLQTIIPMLLADYLARHTSARVSQIVRSTLFVPVVASMILVGTVWQVMLDPDRGIFNKALNAFGLDSVNFLGQPTLALVVVSAIAIWKHIGYFLVIFYAGVLDIPRERYEAATVDGANRWQQFRYITIPGLRPVTFLVVVLGTIWSFQVFDLVYAMTGGGPGGATTTIVMAIYEIGYKNYQMGYAATVAMLLFAIVVGISIFQQYVNRRLSK